MTFNTWTKFQTSGYSGERKKKKEPHQHIRDNFWHKLDHFCFPSLCIISEQTRDEFRIELEIVYRKVASSRSVYGVSTLQF